MIRILLVALFALIAQSASAEESQMDAQALAATTGGSEVQMSSVISENSIGNVGFTGGVNGVYAIGNSGLTTMIENTGNQVSIATSTIVNITYH